MGFLLLGEAPSVGMTQYLTLTDITLQLVEDEYESPFDVEVYLAHVDVLVYVPFYI